MYVLSDDEQNIGGLGTAPETHVPKQTTETPMIKVRGPSIVFQCKLDAGSVESKMTFEVSIDIVALQYGKKMLMNSFNIAVVMQMLP